MIFHRIVAEQSRKPTGFFGSIVGRMMARTNQESNEWVISLLDILPSDHVLEVGFGPGEAIRMLAEKTPHGFVAGIDFSKAMVEQASKLNANEIALGHVELKQGEASSLPYEIDQFDKVYAINVVYVLQALQDVMEELHRVLKPGGHASIYLAPPELMDRVLGNSPPSFFRFYTAEEVESAFQQTGFNQTRTATTALNGGIGRCVIGMK